MKMQIWKKGHHAILVGLCIIACACNKSEEFFGIEEYINGADSFCFNAKDEKSCKDLIGCQPAYSESSNPSSPGKFEICVADPDYYPSDDGGSSGGVDGETSGGNDGGSTSGSNDGGSTSGGNNGNSSSGAGQSNGGVNGSSSGGGGHSSAGGSNGSTAGSTDGGTSSGGDNGSSSGGTDAGSTSGGTDGDDEDTTIEQASRTKCKNLDPKYLWIKKTVSESGTKTEKKVKVCHHTGNDSFHTIIIACPALKAHIGHHDDYLGSCQP